MIIFMSKSISLKSNSFLSNMFSNALREFIKIDFYTLPLMLKEKFLDQEMLRLMALPYR